MAPRRTRRKRSAISKTRRFSKKEAKETDDVQNEVMSQMEEEEEEGRRMWDHLPYGVVVEVLLRLPVKSLVRFRCVCKDWYSLISSNTFIATHANRAVSLSHDKNMSSHAVFGYGIKLYSPFLADGMERCHHFLSVRSDDDNFIDLNIPRYGPFCNPRRYVRGLCNGLLFTISYSEDYHPLNFVLWNPFILRALRLPEPNLMSSTRSLSVYGLGYNPSSDDIKLVRLVYLLEERDPDTQLTPQVEIYTLKSGCWRCITAPIPPYVCSTASILSVFVRGACHWIAHTSSNQDTFRYVIMAFDMVDEVFREIPLPACFVGISYRNFMTLHVRDGLLCLAPCYPEQEQRPFSIWIMKEYGVEESWTKLFDIHMHEELRRVVGFRKMGEVLVTDREGDLLSYEPNTQQVTHLGFHPYSIEGGYYCFEDSDYLWEKCVETMFMLNVKNSVSK